MNRELEYMFVQVSFALSLGFRCISFSFVSSEMFSLSLKNQSSVSDAVR